MSRRAFHFDGITIIVPEQIERRYEIDVVQKEIPLLPEERDRFSVIRPIANIALYYKNDEGNYDLAESLTEFDPPIELRVAYKYEDLVKVGCEINQLKLAFWDGENYVPLSDEEHDYLILPPTTGLMAECKIHTWPGDPPIIWGR